MFFYEELGVVNHDPVDNFGAVLAVGRSETFTPIFGMQNINDERRCNSVL